MSAYNCTDPGSLTNGFFVIAKAYYENGDRVYYYCQWTYFLEGNPIRECDGNTGNWTGSTPTCSTTTTTATTTTTTTEAPVSEWLYMSIGMSSFLALLLICLLGVYCLKTCNNLCRQFTRARDDQEEVETGCCYTCCIHCCSSSCRLCNPYIVPRNPKPKTVSESVQTSSPEPEQSLKLEEVVSAKKVARELKNYWIPHMHGTRTNNQSTR